MTSVFDKMEQRLGVATKAPVQRPEVLLVDDDVGIGSALRFAFQDVFDLVVVHHPERALAGVTDATRCVVLDIQMGLMSGFDVCEALQQVAPHLPVIFHSAFQDAKDPIQIINEHRPFAFITKDGDLSRLRRAIERAVAHAQIIQARIRTQTELAHALEALNRRD